jgi:MFS family permease
MITSVHPQDPAVIERSLRLSVIDGLLYAVMVGVCESYLGAFAVALGHDSSAIALLVTVPMLVGAVSQLYAPVLVGRLGSRQRFVVAAVLVQAAIALPMLLSIALRADNSFTTLLIAKTLFWSTGSIAGAVWNAWMEALTRQVNRERYFAMRSTSVHAMLLFAFVGAGAFLRWRSAEGQQLVGFAAMFAVATVARLSSAYALSRKLDIESRTSALTPIERLRTARREGRFRLPVFMGVFMLGAQISIPFFTPYMLRALKLDLFQFSILIAASILAKALCFPLWARAAKQVGMRGVFLASASVISLLPILWTQLDSFGPLLVLQAVSGAVWAGWEYASLQLLMRDAPRAVGTEYFALTAALSGVLQLIGSVVGSTLLTMTADSYHAAFTLSSMGRMAALLLLIPWLSQLAADRAAWPPLFTRILTVRPTQGAEHRPIVMSDTDADEPSIERPSDSKN